MMSKAVKTICGPYKLVMPMLMMQLPVQADSLQFATGLLELDTACDVELQYVYDRSCWDGRIAGTFR